MYKVKNYLLACVFITLAVNVSAQKYYYFQGEKVNLTIDSTQLIVVTNNSFQALPNIADLTLVENSGYLKKTAFSYKPTKTAYTAAINSLKSNSGVKRVLPAFKRGDGHIGVSDLFYVKLKNQNDFAVLQNVAQQKGVAIVKQIPNMPLWYILQLQDNNSADYLDIVNSIYETGLFAASAPDFLFNFKPMCSSSSYNDPKFAEQGYLRYSNHYNDYNGYGINACAAWDIATGAGVKVAVVDKGIDFTHRDLVNCKEGDGYNTETLSSPSLYYPNVEYPEHGTHVAGIISAERNNGYDIIGVAPDSKIIGVSSNFNVYDGGLAGKLASGIMWAVNEGADIINNSWGDVENTVGYGSEVLENAISYALTAGRGGKGCVVVFPAANYLTGQVGATFYPANCNNGILVVGYINKYGCYMDLIPGIGPGPTSPYTPANNRIDVVAPGSHIISTNPSTSAPTQDMLEGVSFSAALVSGVAALVLEKNPNLTGAEVKRIIKNTADNTKGTGCNQSYGYPNIYGSNYSQFFGSGLVNAYEAVQWATHHDLMIRDDKNDNGTEPNPRQITWNSPDINLLEFDPPHKPIPNSELHNHSKVIVAVTVKNVGYGTSTGTEKLHVHWSKLTVNSYWDYNWKNSSDWQYGDEITDPELGVSIPPLAPKQSTTVYVEWNIPEYLQEQSMSVYGFFKEKVYLNWGIALLARVEDGNKTKDFDEITALPFRSEKFAQINNNIAVSNGNMLLYAEDYTMLAYLERPSGSNFSISYNQLFKEDKYILNDFAEVYALLSNDLMEKLDHKASKGIKIVDGNRVLLTSENSELAFYPLKKDGAYFIGAEVNFISDKMPELNDFDFDFTYKTEKGESEIMRFTAVRDIDVYFKAHAEASKEKVVKAKEEVTLTSNIIYHDATYTWYNEAGKVIGEKYQITIIPEYSQKYKIEIKQEKDGFKAYDEVEVIVVDGMIKSIAPNPATEYIKVEYLLSDNATNASIQISNIQNTVSVSYPILTTENYTEISLPSFVSGYYIVKLIIGGVAVDAQPLIIK